MSRFLRILLLVIVLLILGGAAFLALWEWPAPTQEVEREVPADRLRP